MNRDLEAECQKLRDAMKGLGTDEKALTTITLNHTKKERQNIKLAYKTCFGRDLLEDLSKELSGHYKDTMLALYEDPLEYDAKCLYKAMKGLGTDDEALVEILCTRPNYILKKICETFKRLYNEDLSKWVESDTSGDYRRILLSILVCNRSENTTPDEEKMKEIAHQLYAGGEGKLGTDATLFNKVFATSSPAELASICEWYKKLTGGTKDLKTAVDKEFSGNVKKALLTIIDGIIDPTEYFARRIKKAVKGLGTNNSMLIRVLVSREEIDMKEMREKYQRIFNVDMVKDIADDTSGNYKIAVCGIASK